MACRDQLDNAGLSLHLKILKITISAKTLSLNKVIFTGPRD